jgi:diketogulonate reductase-like aldo/keto reductase
MIHAWEYTGGRIYTNQVEYHPCLSQDAMKAFCEEHDVALTAYSPLGYGNLLENQTLQTIAEKY